MTTALDAICSSLMDDFKTLLDHQQRGKNPVDDQWFEMPISEIETPDSERCSLSYRSLPEHYPDLTCSGRTPFDAMFLNDRWISVPISSEDVKFKNMTKNLHESALFACEDERFEVDMVGVDGCQLNASAYSSSLLSLHAYSYATHRLFCLVQVIESNLSTIQVLQPLAEEIKVLMDQDSSPAWHYRLDPQTLSAVHLKAISRIYGLLSIHCNRHISPRHFQHICVV